MEPVFGDPQSASRTNLQVSFLELVEIAVVARWRKLHVKLGRIRAAHEFARKQMFVPFPFATMDFKILGGHIIHEFEVAEPEPHAGMTAFDVAGQWALPIPIQEELEAIDYGENKFAKNWFPFGRRARIVVDPHYAAGRPIIAGTRITITAIRERFDAGDGVRKLAQDYGLRTSIVEEVLRLAAA